MSLRRRKASRLRPFWMLFVFALMLAIVAGYVGATWPGFRPKSVRVVGNVLVPTREILWRARIDPRRNVWLQNTGAMASRIEEIPYVLTAHVHRQPPGDVTIAIVERRPFALVRSGDEMALIDASLRVLDVGGDANGAMPLLVLEPGIDLAPGRTLRQSSARALLAVTLSLRAHGVAADEVDDEGGDVRVRLPGGARVLLGDETSATKAVPLVEPILTRFALLGREVRVLDLRSPTTPVVTEGGQSAPAPAPKPTAPESPPAPRRSP